MIAESLAQDAEACEQIAYGARAAIAMRISFWDAMLEQSRQPSHAVVDRACNNETEYTVS